MVSNTDNPGLTKNWLWWAFVSAHMFTVMLAKSAFQFLSIFSSSEIVVLLSISPMLITIQSF